MSDAVSTTEVDPLAEPTARVSKKFITILALANLGIWTAFFAPINFLLPLQVEAVWARAPGDQPGPRVGDRRPGVAGLPAQYPAHSATARRHGSVAVGRGTVAQHRRLRGAAGTRKPHHNRRTGHRLGACAVDVERLVRRCHGDAAGSGAGGAAGYRLSPGRRKVSQWASSSVVSSRSWLPATTTRETARTFATSSSASSSYSRPHSSCSE